MFPLRSMIGIILTVDGKTKDFVLNYFSLSSVFFVNVLLMIKNR